MDINEELIGKKVMHNGLVYKVKSFKGRPSLTIENENTGNTISFCAGSPIANNLKLFEEPEFDLSKHIIKIPESFGITPVLEKCTGTTTECNYTHETFESKEKIEFVSVEKVKEFIKQIKNILPNTDLDKKLNKLAGGRIK